MNLIKKKVSNFTEFTATGLLIIKGHLSSHYISLTPPIVQYVVLFYEGHDFHRVKAFQVTPVTVN